MQGALITAGHHFPLRSWFALHVDVRAQVLSRTRHECLLLASAYADRQSRDGSVLLFAQAGEALPLRFSLGRGILQGHRGLCHILQLKAPASNARLLDTQRQGGSPCKRGFGTLTFFDDIPRGFQRYENRTKTANHHQTLDFIGSNGLPPPAGGSEV